MTNSRKVHPSIALVATGVFRRLGGQGRKHEAASREVRPQYGGQQYGWEYGLAVIYTAISLFILILLALSPILPVPDGATTLGESRAMVRLTGNGR